MHSELRRTSSLSHRVPPAGLEGAMVEARLGNLAAACSGLVFSDGRFVLSHGALLSAVKCPVSKPEHLGELAVPITIPSLKLRVIRDKHQGYSSCILAAWWTCPLLSAGARDLHLEGWRFTPDDDQDYESLGTLLVLTVDTETVPSLSSVRQALQQLLQEHVYQGIVTMGTPVLLESTPFGSKSLFLNSWSSGVLSAITGKHNALLLCDAHAAPGSEGGALYLQGNRMNLVGLVVLPFSVVRGEAITLCLCATLAPVLKQILCMSGSGTPPRANLVNDEEASTPTLSSPSAAQHLLKRSGVALLRHGESWASAVSVDAEKGIFLTCSHVFQGDGDTWLQWTDKGVPCRAEIVYRSAPNTAYDIAVVRVIGPGPPAPRLAAPIKGESVLVVGYSVLMPRVLHWTMPFQEPMVTAGCVSLTGPHMLQTTCAVHSGASGGAIMRPSTGELLGIVVGHMRAVDANPLPRDWPRLNFAVPSTAIAPALQAYLRTEDVSVLHSLEVSDAAVQRLWRLETQIPWSKL